MTTYLNKENKHNKHNDRVHANLLLPSTLVQHTTQETQLSLSDHCLFNIEFENRPFALERLAQRTRMLCLLYFVKILVPIVQLLSQEGFNLNDKEKS